MGHPLGTVHFRTDDARWVWDDWFMTSAEMSAFDTRAFLHSAGIATKAAYRRGEVIFWPGDAAVSVMYVDKGGVKLSVRSQTGREAVMAMLGPDDFFGEGCLVGHKVRMRIATAVMPSAILVIGRAKMRRLLHTQSELADRFITFVLGTNIRIEEDLTVQLFNHEEKRLARALLRLARYGTLDKPQRIIPCLSSATLATMVGASRTKVEFLMKRFQRLGFIDKDEGLTIHDSLLSVVLRD